MRHESAPRAPARAMAERSDPPRPRVMVSPEAVAAWKPVTTATRPEAQASSTRTGLTDRMRPSPQGPPARNPAWAPVKETAGHPCLPSSMAIRAADCCSPVARSWSSSLLSGVPPEVSPERAIRLLVVLPMADTTTATLRPERKKPAIRPAPALILSGFATDVPPNLSTTPSPLFHTGFPPFAE